MTYTLPATREESDQKGANQHRCQLIVELKIFRNFSVNSASCSLFWRVFAGCSSMRRKKEKPPETCLFPVV
jgi:hypothetical protein